MNQNQYEQSARELFALIAKSPTSFHAVRQITLLLQAAGFSELREAEAWNLAPGGSYYVTRADSALMAFRVPAAPAQGFHIVAAHSDAPAFKLKDCPERPGDGGVALNVEAYGGMLCAPWFDRPLSVAGRVVVEENGALKVRLVDFDRPLVSIVNLAIHMNREANSGYHYHTQKDMQPLWAGAGSKRTLRAAVAEELEVPESAVTDTELYLYNKMEGCIWGAEREFLSAPRLDDLECAFAAVKALCATPGAQDKLCVAAIFDNEEVGSGTRQGALSTFLTDVLHRAYTCLGHTEEDWYRAAAGSFLLSADNGHALHPNYPEACDPTNHPHVGGGVLLKYAGNQKYTTDAWSGAVVRTLCKQAGVPCQPFYNHSDRPGGSTLGNLSAQQLSVPAADIGAAVLAMHSPYETGSVRDPLELETLMRAFYETALV